MHQLLLKLHSPHLQFTQRTQQNAIVTFTWGTAQNTVVFSALANGRLRASPHFGSGERNDPRGEQQSQTSLSRPFSCAVCAWGFRISPQPPPQALRFSHGRGERETRVTGDEPQGTMGRVQTAGEARCLLPAFLCAYIFNETETSGYEADIPQ